jgi:hypothetical protein
MPSRRPADRGRGTPSSGVQPIERAFDALRFGADRTLNLRDALPTAEQATARADAWLRQQQADGVHEVLVITGRGLGSLDGVGRVREAVLRKLVQLKRLNVVDTITEHTPGSCIVTLQPFAAVIDAPRLRKKKAATAPPPADPAELAALSPDTRAALRALAQVAIERLGVRSPSDAMLAGEMRAQFAALVPAIPADAPDRDAALRELAERLRWELLDDHPS